MRAARAFGMLDAGSRALACLLGVSAIVIAAAVAFGPGSVGGVTDWLGRVFGVVFSGLFVLLGYIALLAWARIGQVGLPPAITRTWLEAGLQAAGGIGILALTYTLLGISLGIGSLSGQPLTPATVQDVIRSLTEHFSMAFMTTVIGLPVSAVLRALLLVTHCRVQERALRLPAP